jgi:hypothetical protein
MARQVLLECSFLIPVRRDRNLSDGARHLSHCRFWLEHALFVFGGATRAPDLYTGWYLDPDTGEQIRDRSRKYFVAVQRAQVGELRDLLRQACATFQQKCIYLSVAGRVEFVEGGNDAASQ